MQGNYSTSDAHMLRLSFNWRFGIFYASLFIRKNLNVEHAGMKNGMMGVGQ